MSRPYDSSFKDLVFEHPNDWLAFLGLTGSGVEVVDTDLSTVTASADKVLKVQGPAPWLLHLEAQSSGDAKLGERLSWYNSLLRHRHGLSVRTVVVLLRPAADVPVVTGLYEDRFPGEAPYVSFRYGVVRIWQVPADTIVAGGLGIVPLAPLGATTDLGGVIGRMWRRLQREVPQVASSLWAAAYLLTGLRYPADVAGPLWQGVANMLDLRDSSTYQALLAEGLAQGRAEGRAEEARAILTRLGAKRFGTPDQQTVAALEAITDAARLEELAEALLTATGWHDLLGGLKG